MTDFTITPQMLLGALIIFAAMLLFAVVFGLRWARAAIKFGRGFESFRAARLNGGRIDVQATFGQAPSAPASERGAVTRFSDWLSGKPVAPEQPRGSES